MSYVGQRVITVYMNILVVLGTVSILSFLTGEREQCRIRPDCYLMSSLSGVFTGWFPIFNFGPICYAVKFLYDVIFCVESLDNYSRTPDGEGCWDNSGIFILFLNGNICCDPSLEPSRRDGSNFGSQHVFWRDF